MLKLLIPLSAIGILVVIAILSIAPFKQSVYSLLYPKPQAFAYTERWTTTPPGYDLSQRTDAYCAANIQRTDPSNPRPIDSNSSPNNGIYNNQIPTQAQLSLLRPFSQFGMNTDIEFNRVTGAFTGTTDEIIQWIACKWGVEENIVRAEAMDESVWHEHGGYGNGLGDDGSCNNPSWVSDGHGGCYHSYGILQLRDDDFKAYPMSYNYTAMNADLVYAWIRSCYEGYSYSPPQAKGDIWGCLGFYYSGTYNSGSSDSSCNGSGALWYICNVKRYYNNQSWSQFGYTYGGGSITPTPTPGNGSPTPTQVQGGPLQAGPLLLTFPALNQGGTQTGKITYTNNGSSSVTIKDLVITARQPGGSNSQPPYYDFSPRGGVLTIQPGASQAYTLTATYQFKQTDPSGVWYAFSTYQDSNGAWHDGSPVPFTLGAVQPTLTPPASPTPTPSPTTTPIPTELYSIFGRRLNPSWQDWSWSSTNNFFDTSHPYLGRYDVAWTPTSSNAGLNFHNSSGVDTTGFVYLKVVMLASSPNEQAQMLLVDNNNQVIGSPYTLIFNSSSYSVLMIPLTSLGGNNRVINGVQIINNSGNSEPTIYIGALQFTD